VLVFAAGRSSAATTIDATDRFAYGANLGWVDWRGDTNHGAVIGEFVCSGFLHAANVGWINLGNGSPTNGIQYGNLAAGDFGVNQDGLGNLRGLAYGANVGWLNFEGTGAPRVDLLTGALSGSVWSANCGWISLSNAVALVRTDSVAPGAPAPDGLPIAWLLANFGTTNLPAGSDPTGKGITIAQDYLAGTNPNGPNSLLRITTAQFSPGGVLASVSWSSVPSRYYVLEKTESLAPAAWEDSGLGLIPPLAGLATSATLSDSNAPARFYRIQAVRPLFH